MDEIREKYKLKFTVDDEDKIIDFVKQNEILYNCKHRYYRDTEAKNKLWLVLATELNKHVDDVKKKWKAMRDYFIRNREKNGTGSPATSAVGKRDESLLFLLQTSIMKRDTITNVESATESVSSFVKNAEDFVLDGSQIDVFSPVDGRSLLWDYEKVDHNDFSDLVMSTPQPKKPKKKTKEIDVNKMVQEFLVNRPKLSLATPENSTNSVHKFFQYMATTVENFPPSDITNVKLQPKMVAKIERRLNSF